MCGKTEYYKEPAMIKLTEKMMWEKANEQLEQSN